MYHSLIDAKIIIDKQAKLRMKCMLMATRRRTLVLSVMKEKIFILNNNIQRV